MRSRFSLFLLSLPSLGGVLLAAQPAVAQQSAPAPVSTVPAEASALPAPLRVPIAPPPAPAATPGAAGAGTAVPPADPAASIASPTIVAPNRPSPTPTPRAVATSRREPAGRIPVPGATATPRDVTPRSPAATPEAPPAATPTPGAPPVAGAIPAPGATAPTASTASIEPRDVEGSPWLGWLIVLPAGVAVLIAGLLWRRRRRGAALAPSPAIDPDAAAALPPAPPVAIADPDAHADAVPDERAWVTFALTPRRAGVNLLTATLEAVLVVRNEGEAVAEEVRIDVRLLSARIGQESELATLFAETAETPVVAPFALAAGEERAIDLLVTATRAQLNVLSAAGRPMFVPVAAVNVRYVSSGGSGGVHGQTAAGFAIGVEREGTTKLTPFWLDTPGRMHDRLAARPHALSLRS